jgi:hypothetical protein
LKRDGTRVETRFRLPAKRTSPFKSAGASVQSTTGSRVVRISGSNAGYTVFRGSVKNTGFPLHPPVPPSLPLPCVTVCHHISTGLNHHSGHTNLRGRATLAPLTLYRREIMCDKNLGNTALLIRQYCCRVQEKGAECDVSLGVLVMITNESLGVKFGRKLCANQQSETWKRRRALR